MGSTSKPSKEVAESAINLIAKAPLESIVTLGSGNKLTGASTKEFARKLLLWAPRTIGNICLESAKGVFKILGKGAANARVIPIK